MEPVQMPVANLKPEAVAEYNRLKRRNTKIGLAWLIAPIVTLFVILTAYAIAQFVISSLLAATAVDTVSTTSADMQLGAEGLGTSDVRVTIAAIIKVALSLIGIFAVIGMMVGVPIGIIYLTKRVFVNGMVFDERSGKGGISIVPEEIKSWNWGAVGLPVIWGLSHRVWISLVCLIPFVSLVFMFVMGVHGNEWAWQAEKWESVEAFKRHQDKWKVWGIIFFALNVLIIFAQFANALS